MSSGIVVIIVLAAAIVAAVGGFFGRKYLGEARIASAEVAARKMLEEAERQAESLRREARVELKDELHQVQVAGRSRGAGEAPGADPTRESSAGPRRGLGRGAEGHVSAGAVGGRPREPLSQGHRRSRGPQGARSAATARDLGHVQGAGG